MSINGNLIAIFLCIGLSTKSTVECNPGGHFEFLNFGAQNHEEQPSVTTPVGASGEGSLNNNSELPCDNFICLLQKFELLKTENGYLLKKTPVATAPKIPKSCKSFSCWKSQFEIIKTSYGFELSQKVHRDESPPDFGIFRSQTTTSTTASPPTPVQEPPTINREEFNIFENFKENSFSSDLGRNFKEMDINRLFGESLDIDQDLSLFGENQQNSNFDNLAKFDQGMSEDFYDLFYDNSKRDQGYRKLYK